MIYTDVLALITNRVIGEEAGQFWGEFSITKPTHVIPWEGDSAIFDESNDTAPARPYLAVDFADVPLSYFEGQKEGEINFKVMVVVDNFHRGRSGSEDRLDWREKLAYAGHIERLLDMYDGLHVMGYEKPIFAGNQIITALNVYRKVRYPRSRLPWSPPVEE